jgi:hypothetical protein
MTQAALNYRQAAALLPEDEGIRRNLDRALRALGRVQPAAPDSVDLAATAESGVASFYWMD